MKIKDEPEMEVENNEENPLQLSHPTSNIELYFDEATECIRVVDEDVNDGYEIDLNSINDLGIDLNNYSVNIIGDKILEINCQFEGK